MQIKRQMNSEEKKAKTFKIAEENRIKQEQDKPYHEAEKSAAGTTTSSSDRTRQI